MNHLRLALVATAIAGCSAPQPQSVAPPVTVVPIANRLEFHNPPYVMEAPDAGLKAPQFCHLGSDCMELDSRPFTSCLVSGEPCEGEGGVMWAAPEK